MLPFDQNGYLLIFWSSGTEELKRAVDEAGRAGAVAALPLLSSEIAAEVDA